MAIEVIQVPKIIKVVGVTIFLNNVAQVFVDSTVTPNQIVVQFVGGGERRFAVNSTEGVKLAAWANNNSLIEVLP